MGVQVTLYTGVKFHSCLTKKIDENKFYYYEDPICLDSQEMCVNDNFLFLEPKSTKIYTCDCLKLKEGNKKEEKGKKLIVADIGCLSWHDKDGKINPGQIYQYDNRETFYYGTFYQFFNNSNASGLFINMSDSHSLYSGKWSIALRDDLIEYYKKNKKSMSKSIIKYYLLLKDISNKELRESCIIKHSETNNENVRQKHPNISLTKI